MAQVCGSRVSKLRHVQPTFMVAHVARGRRLLDDELRRSHRRELAGVAAGANPIQSRRMVVTRESRWEHGAALTQATSVSVLIPTHEDAHLLRRSLPPFVTNARLAVEVVILNNDPCQDVGAAIGEPGADPRVRILEIVYEADFSRAINRGIRESSGELVMLCDADLFPSAGYLSELFSFFERCPAAGAAAGKLPRYELDRDRPTEVIGTAGFDLNRQRRFTPRGEGELDRRQVNKEMEVFGLDGAAIIVRRAASEDIRFRDEYLDENFVTHEDHDVPRGACVSPAGNAGTFREPWRIMRVRRAASPRRSIPRPFAPSRRTTWRSQSSVVLMR